jgi:hypothetical protein
MLARAEEFLARAAGQDAPRQVLDARTAAAPASGERALLVWRKFLQKLGRKLDEKLYFWQWFVLYHASAELTTSLGRFKALTPPKDRFWADPFVVARDGKHYVFIEELPAHIASMPVAVNVQCHSARHKEVVL